MTVHPSASAPRRYAIVGSGAVGLFYGIRLATAGHPVQFLERSAAPQVRRRGLRLTSADGDLTVPRPDVAQTWDQLEPCDVLIVATKATANPDVAARLALHADRLLGPEGIVLLAQNGIGAEARFADAAPGRPVLAGLAFLCAQRTAPGQVAHLDYGALTLAEHRHDEQPAGLTAAMTAVAEDVGATGTPVALDEDLVRARWRKLMWNLPFNPLSVVLDASTAALVGDAGTERLVRDLMGEVAAVACAEGHELPPGLADSLIAATTRMTPYDTSMKVDADAGRPLEIEPILAEPVRRGRAAGVPMPRSEALLALLGFVDGRPHRD